MGKSVNIENGPVTVVWNWTVKPDKDELFEKMMHDVHKVAITFPGHMGVTTLRSASQKGKSQTVLRFDNTAHLEAWLNSDIRKKMAELISEIAQIETSTKATGLETWFDLPGQPVIPPPRWKMAVTTSIAIYPLSLIYGYFIAPHTLIWPVAARSLILPVFAPVILTYLFMPILTQHVLKPWLYNKSDR